MNFYKLSPIPSNANVLFDTITTDPFEAEIKEHVTISAITNQVEDKRRV